MKQKEFINTFEENIPLEWDFQFISGLTGTPSEDFYQIQAEVTESTCDACSEMNGKIFAKSEAVIGKNFPPFHPNCCCKAVDENGSLIIINENESYEIMNQSYGFTKKESGLILKAYKLLSKETDGTNISRQKKIHHIFSVLAALCDNYSGEAFRWKVSAGVASTSIAKNHLKKLGMSSEEVAFLYKAINKQHQSTGNEKLNKDFAHELVQYAIFADNSLVHNILDGLIGNMNALGSYKGDVFSTRMGKDDMNSDLDATNIYNRMISNNKDLFDTILEYNSGVKNGHINRFAEFLEFYGEGNVAKGLEYIKDDLNFVDIGSHYIGGTTGGIFGFIRENIQDALFTNAMAQSGIVFQGEDTFNNIFKNTNANQVFQESVERKKAKPKEYKFTIEETEAAFIKYLEEGIGK